MADKNFDFGDVVLGFAFGFVIGVVLVAIIVPSYANVCHVAFSRAKTAGDSIIVYNQTSCSLRKD